MQHFETSCAPSSGAIDAARATSFHTYAGLVRMEKSGNKAKNCYLPLELDHTAQRHAPMHTCCHAVGDRVLHTLRHVACLPMGAIHGARASSFHTHARLVRMEKSGTKAKLLHWLYNSPTLHSDMRRDMLQ